jgi:hypothetical protein
VGSARGTVELVTAQRSQVAESLSAVAERDEGAALSGLEEDRVLGSGPVFVVRSQLVLEECRL